ncbi:unnamed protein product [Rhodiola kirilowii]
MKTNNNALFLALMFTFLATFSTQAATVPAANQFKFVNEGDFGERSVEYFADYRVSTFQTTPFALAFYNTTPNAYTLAIRMGNSPSESFYRWVWQANRAIPVKENASLSLGKDGNLILAEANGKVVWQTNTANKNVVEMSLLPNGNLVLLDNKGKFMWQSFDYPTDTLLVGQSFRSTGVKRLVSRVSASDGSPGPYSYGIDGRLLSMKYQVKNSKQFFYYHKSDVFSNEGSLANLTFQANPEDLGFGIHAYELGFNFTMNGSPSSGTTIIARPKYNVTLSFIRIDFDGNLRIYSLDPPVDWNTWDITFVQFTRDPNALNAVSECYLPKRCGALGVCEDDQCVACPRPQGLLGWNKECLPPVLPPCKNGTNVDYYKVIGAEHYSSEFNDGTGPIKVADCQKKCDSDCKCLGFFYKAESSKCLVVPEIGTIVKVSNSSHVAYIKKSK